MAQRKSPLGVPVLSTLLALALAGCSQGEGPSLSKAASAPTDEIPNVPVPPVDGPKLGALANVTQVFERPATDAPVVGYLHAGATVARAEEPYTDEGCPGGWYPIRPKGFVCVGETATVDLAHPTLVAMSLRPRLDDSLPYTYARTTKATLLLERDPDRENAVREVRKLPRRTGMAIVGSWNAIGPKGETHRLGMLTNGLFVKAADLRASEPSEFAGVEIGEQKLPVGYVVKRGVRAWHIEGGEAFKRKKYEYHQFLPLTGRFRTIRKLRFWAYGDDQWARHRDITVVRRRNNFPDFAKGHQKWIDVSIVTGTMILYQGRKPIFATLASVGRDRLGDPKKTASTEMGTFTVKAKHITGATIDPKQVADSVPLHDVPWVIELSSGQLLHGAYWHDRFGIEHGPGNVQISPADAARVWNWVDPKVPDHWHALTKITEGDRTVVVVRK